MILCCMILTRVTLYTALSAMSSTQHGQYNQGKNIYKFFYSKRFCSFTVIGVIAVLVVGSLVVVLLKCYFMKNKRKRHDPEEVEMSEMSESLMHENRQPGDRQAPLLADEGSQVPFPQNSPSGSMVPENLPLEQSPPQLQNHEQKLKPRTVPDSTSGYHTIEATGSTAENTTTDITSTTGPTTTTIGLSKGSSEAILGKTKTTTGPPQGSGFPVGAAHEEFKGGDDVRPKQRQRAAATPNLAMAPENQPQKQSPPQTPNPHDEKFKTSSSRPVASTSGYQTDINSPSKEKTEEATGSTTDSKESTRKTIGITTTAITGTTGTRGTNKGSSGMISGTMETTIGLPQGQPVGADDTEFAGDNDVRPKQQGPTAAPSLSMAPENQPQKQSPLQTQNPHDEKFKTSSRRPVASTSGYVTDINSPSKAKTEDATGSTTDSKDSTRKTIGITTTAITWTTTGTRGTNKGSSGMISGTMETTIGLPQGQPVGRDDTEFAGDNDVRPKQQGPPAAASSLSMAPENRPHEQSSHESQSSHDEKRGNMAEKKTLYKREVNNNSQLMTTALCEEEGGGEEKEEEEEEEEEKDLPPYPTREMGYDNLRSPEDQKSILVRNC